MLRTLLGEGGLARRYRRPGREFLWIVTGQMLAVTGGIVGVRLLTQVLSPATYGQLALGVTVAALTQQVLLGPLASAFLRFFAPAREAGDLTAYMAAVRKLLVLATIAVLAFAALGAVGLLSIGRASWLVLWIVAVFFSLSSGYNAALNNVFTAARERPMAALHMGVGQWLRFLAATAMVVVIGAWSSAALAGYALASAVVLGSQIFFIRRKLLSWSVPQVAVMSHSVEHWATQMRAYAWPFATWGIFTWAQLASGRWALEVFALTSDVGLYAVLYQVGYFPLMMLSGSVGQLITPVLFSRAGDASDEKRMHDVRRVNSLLVIASVSITVAGAALTLVLHDQIFSLLVAPQFRSVSNLLPLMVLSGGLFASGQTASILLLSRFESQHLIAPKVATGLLGAILSFLGAYWWGLQGVVFAGLAFALSYLVWVLILTGVKSGKRLTSVRQC